MINSNSVNLRSSYKRKIIKSRLTNKWKVFSKYFYVNKEILYLNTSNWTSIVNYCKRILYLFWLTQIMKSVNFNNDRLLNALIPDKRPIQNFAWFSTSVSMTVCQYNLSAMNCLHVHYNKHSTSNCDQNNKNLYHKITGWNG